MAQLSKEKRAIITAKRIEAEKALTEMDEILLQNLYDNFQDAGKLIKDPETRAALMRARDKIIATKAPDQMNLDVEYDPYTGDYSIETDII